MAIYKDIQVRGLAISAEELFQKDIEENFPEILAGSICGERIGNHPASDFNIVIIGAWRGEEIRSFLRWPNSRVFAFEPNPENFAYLRDVYKGNSRVSCFQLACSDKDGTATLFQANLTGNDSLLQIQEREGFRMTGSHEVRTVKLDSVPEIADLANVDLLWVDVQGFEKFVLAGAQETLKRVKGVFIELNDNDKAYKGATRIAELLAIFSQAGFRLAYSEVSENPDNGIRSGNGVFLRNEIETDFFDQHNIDVRTAMLAQSLASRRRLTRNWAYKIIARLLPSGIKKKIKYIFA